MENVWVANILGLDVTFEKLRVLLGHNSFVLSLITGRMQKKVFQTIPGQCLEVSESFLLEINFRKVVCNY